MWDVTDSLGFLDLKKLDFFKFTYIPSYSGITGKSKDVSSAKCDIFGYSG